MMGEISVLPRSFANEWINLRRLSADLALVATGAAVLGLFAISAVTLEYFGVAYITTGGGLLSKFHPSTFLVVLALALRCFATGRPLRTGWRLVSNDPGVVMLLTATSIACVHAVLISKTPVTPLVDTFVLPVLCFLLLRDLEPTLVRWLALLVAVILCANAAMAMIEFARGLHFLTPQFPANASSDPTRSDAVFDWRVDITQDWRAVALLGHPLVNGLIVGCFIMCLAAPGASWVPAWLRVPLLMFQGASMFTFGARTSLVFTLAVVCHHALNRSIKALRSGRRFNPSAVALALIAIAVVIGAGAALVSGGFFDRTLERFASDSGSAATRLTMFEMFEPMSWSDLVFAPDQEVVATWQRILGLEFGIESSWVGLALTYGLLVTSILMVGLAAFTWSVARACGRGAGVMLGLFLVSVSATASMSGKTTSFAMAVTLALLLLAKDERRPPLLRTLGFAGGPTRARRRLAMNPDHPLRPTRSLLTHSNRADSAPESVGSHDVP